MISDDDLYSLAVFLGCLSVLLIVVYHFLEVNAIPDAVEKMGTGKPEAKSAIEKAAR
jgi:oligosaccharyl transferase complex subunit OST4